MLLGLALWMVFFFSFILTFDISSLWSIPLVAADLVLAEKIELLIMLFIWFLYWLSVDVPLSTRLFSGLNHIYTNYLLSSQYFMSHSPAYFYTPSPNFLTVVDSALFPTFALRSPMIIKTACLGVHSISFWTLTWNFQFLSQQDLELEQKLELDKLSFKSAWYYSVRFCLIAPDCLWYILPRWQRFLWKPLNTQRKWVVPWFGRKKENCHTV